MSADASARPRSCRTSHAAELSNPLHSSDTYRRELQLSISVRLQAGSCNISEPSDNTGRTFQRKRGKRQNVLRWITESTVKLFSAALLLSSCVKKLHIRVVKFQLVDVIIRWVHPGCRRRSVNKQFAACDGWSWATPLFEMQQYGAISRLPVMSSNEE
jgi:hypothetical protein